MNPTFEEFMSFLMENSCIKEFDLEFERRLRGITWMQIYGIYSEVTNTSRKVALQTRFQKRNQCLQKESLFHSYYESSIR